MPQEPTIGTDEHVIIAGKTGTGKTIVAEVYLAGFSTHVIMLDTKGQIFERRKKGIPLWMGLEEGIDFTVVETLQALTEVETLKAIYCPIPEEQNQDAYDDFFKYCYNRQDVTVWVDELMSVAESANKFPFHLKAILTRGRSRETSLWMCTQRPLEIPSLCLSSSTHFFIFNLKQPQDRKRIIDVTGCPEFERNPKAIHDFWYYRDGWESPILGRLNLERG